MSILRMFNKRSHKIETFCPEVKVVYDKGACDMPQLKEMMMSGYTPNTRVARYHTDMLGNVDDDDILDSVSKPPLDVTDVIDSKNIGELNKVVRKDDETPEQQVENAKNV